jgi:hypothetical protein
MANGYYCYVRIEDEGPDSEMHEGKYPRVPMRGDFITLSSGRRPGVYEVTKVVMHSHNNPIPMVFVRS